MPEKDPTRGRKHPVGWDPDRRREMSEPKKKKSMNQLTSKEWYAKMDELGFKPATKTNMRKASKGK